MISGKAISSKIKSVVKSLAVEAILEAVRGSLLEKMKGLTPDDLYKAIKDDADPWKYAGIALKKRGKRWASKLKKYKDRLTVDLVVAWLAEDRPELCSLILNMPEGKQWLARRLEDIKCQLWPEEAAAQPQLKVVEAQKQEAAEPVSASVRFA